MADGQQADFGQGSISVGGLSVRLRSRKAAAGTSVAELMGQAATASTGSLGRSRTLSLSGSASASGTGNMTPSESPDSGEGEVFDALCDLPYIQLGEEAIDGPTTVYASGGLNNASNYLATPMVSTLVDWENEGGDWWDSAGTEQGSVPYASSQVISGVGTPTNWFIFSVGSLIQDLLDYGNSGIIIQCTEGLSGAFNPPGFATRTSGTPPTLSVTTDVDTYTPTCLIACSASTASSSTVSHHTGATIIRMSPGFLKFDLSDIEGTVSSATLTVTIVDAPNPQTYHIELNRLRMPALISNPAIQVGGATDGLASTVAIDTDLEDHPNVLFYPPWTSMAAIRASDWSNAATLFDSGYPPEPEFITWDDYGIPAMRFSSQYPGWVNPGTGGEDGSSMLSWRYFVSGTEFYCRYIFMVEDDVQDAIDPAIGGVKLPGFESGPFPGSHCSFRQQHLDTGPSNPYLVPLSTHDYDAEFLGQPIATNRSLNVALKAGRKYTIDQRIKMNTRTGGIANADGIHQMWVDDVLRLDRQNVVLEHTDNTPANNTLSNFFLNFYHGGLGYPLAQFHYQIAGVCVATERVGRPKLQGARVPYILPCEGEAIEIPQTNAWSDPRPSAHGIGSWADANFNSYSGGRFVEDYSPVGAFVIAGTGGHTAEANLGALLFDFTDATWKYVAAVGEVYNTDGADYTLAQTDGAPHYEITGTSIPAPAHTYNGSVALPTSLGGGTKGSIVLPPRAALTTTSVSTETSHRFDLATGVWSRFSTDDFTNDSDLNATNGLLDEARNRIWIPVKFPHNFASIQYLDLADFQYKLSNFSSAPPEASAYWYWFMYEGYLISLGMYLFDPDNPTAGYQALNYTGDLPISPEGQCMPWVYYPTTGKFYKPKLFGGQTLHRMTPPVGDLVTGTWVIDTVNVSQALPASADVGQDGQYLHNRWCYVPAIERLALVQGTYVWLVNPT
jgi:hypothetical protein